MRKHISKWVVAASALVILAPTSVVVAWEPVPIVGNITIGRGYDVSFNFPFLTQTRSITAFISPLGPITGVVHDTFNVVSSTFSDTFTLYVASGDSIVGSGIGTVIQNDIAEILTITGGTGGFAGATGSAIGVGQNDPATGVSRESLRGIIATPGSPR
jgi:hypothetical protein